MPHDVAPRIVETADGRAVGYRRFGEGPPIAMLHASPRSAAALVPLGRRLADRFTVFAFDTPGFGWSDPLALARPDAEDYGDALIDTFDALGIMQAPVYGSHTGAAIAVAAALRHPNRVPALALDGYAMFTATQQAEYLANYLAPLAPSWDGTHLAFLWSRVKDQFTVFPWYLRGQAARIPRELVSLTVMQGVINDFLAAGDAYRPGYAAAFRFDGDARLRALTVPTVVMAREDDLLFGHLDALTDLPAVVVAEPLAATDAALTAAVATALSRGVAGVAPAIPPLRPRAPWYEIVRVPGGTIGMCSFGGTAAAKPLVLLSGIPGSARGEADLARALGDRRQVFGVDLPGFGASDLTGTLGIPMIVDGILAALRGSGMSEFDVVAIGESGAIGCALAAAIDTSRVVLVDPVPDFARDALVSAMADVTPRGDGGHLLAAWHQLRDTCLWRPWFDATPANAVEFGTDPDVARMQAILTDWMRGGTRGRATLGAALATKLEPLPYRTSVVALPDHAWAIDQAAFSVAKGVKFAGVRGGRFERAQAILRALDQPL
jgi:pimeloyl-ACP methyl ester carboxylesterase